MNNRIIAVFIFFAASHFLSGQVLDISLSLSPEIVICSSPEQMVIKLTNNSTQPINTAEISITLPTGIEYVIGSLQDMFNSNAIENTSSGIISITSSAIDIGDSSIFSIDYAAFQAAIGFQNSGEIFRNTVQAYYNSDSMTTLSSSFNILYPTLSILDINPKTTSIISGANKERTIKIINGGNGKTDQIFITDQINSNNLQIINTNIGVLSGDTIILSGSDFSSIGNFDNYFDQNESIIITETLLGTSCADLTTTSSIKVHWGCNGDIISSSTSFANLSIDFKTPNLKLIANSAITSCFGPFELAEQSLAITNIGTGISSNTMVDIFKSSGNGYDQTIFSKFDPNSFLYRIGINGIQSSFTNITFYPTTDTGQYNCLGNSPIGKINTATPSLSPGDTLYITWTSSSCCLTTCTNQKIMGWASNITYSDICNTNSYNQSITGQGSNDQEISFTTETPIDLIAGVPKDYTFIVSSFQNTLSQGDGAHYTARFQLDSDLTYKNLSFVSNGVYWSPYFVDYNTNTNTVIAKYVAQAPFTIPKSELVLNIEGTCGIQGWKTINFDFSYTADTTCINGTCEIPLECSKQVTSYLHCPDPNCNTLNVLYFTINRTNYGQPDNNLDGNPDNSGGLDFSKIKTNRAMVGDTIEAISTCVIGSSSSNWSYLTLSSDIDYGSVLQALNTSIDIYDASSQQWFTVNGIPASKTTAQNQANFTYDLSISNLSAIDTSLTNFQFESNDSILIQNKYRVMSSVAGLLKESTFLNDLYLSQVSNPSSAQKESCNFKHGRITLIGYDWRNDRPNNITITSCSKIASQNFGLSIGDKSSNYNGGNLFPYEYRHWGIITEAYMIIPNNYQHTSTKLKYYRTKKTNSSISKTINNIAPDAISGDTLFYNLNQYFDSGQLDLSDDGFGGKLQVELAPNCFASVNTYENIDWLFKYKESEAINSNTSSLISATSPDKIKFSPPHLNLTSDDPWQDANTKFVNWDFKIKNTSTASSDNNWIHIDAPTNIQIDSITNDQTGQLLIQQSDIYLVGEVGNNSNADLTIHGIFTGCDSILFTVYSGAECTGYPTSFSDFNCSFKSLVLYVEPKLSAYQPRISSLLMPDPCAPQVDITVDITSVKLAYMYDMTIDFITPDSNKISVLNNMSQFKYNYASSFYNIADPLYQNNNYLYDINQIHPYFIVNGIPGVLDTDNNRYQLKSRIELGSAFQNGDYLQIQINGKNACGLSLPTVNLAYDPNSKFKKDNTAGLTLDIKNNWSGSWGDYDNDGYEDLFVPSKSLNETNTLYHNNQNGTFTKITNGEIATDLGASVSGTWGDYDNDGFLDLFVANNENSANKLYHNNGNGTFTSVQNSPIVDLGIYTHSAAWADYNQDGNLDLVISDFHPTNFNFLFKGDGLGGFTEDAASMIGHSATSAVGVAWGDYDNDGDQDLFIANTNGENNQLFINNLGVFEEEFGTNIVTDGGSSVGGVWGDYDNDGDLDLYVTNSSDIEVNFFYENNNNGTFSKITNSIITANASTSHGASWIDYDNDGDLDLMVANDQNRANFLFANNGDKTFTKLSNAITEETGNSLGTAWADFDNDGDYDLFVANRGGHTNDFFINEKGSCTNHIKIKLTGCNSNKYGIGALVKVKANIDGNPVWQTKHISTQTSAMGGQNSSILLFGLKTASSVDSVIVLWPSGIITEIDNPTINQLLTINEDCGSKICGTIFFDENENGVKDSNEVGISNKGLTITPGNFMVTTGENGQYQFYLNDGDYTLSMSASSNWEQTAPLNNSSFTLSINKANASVYCGNDFGAKALCPDPDLEIAIGSTAFRRGLANLLHVVVSNKGAFETNSIATLKLEMSKEVYLTDNSWTSTTEFINSRVYEYNFSNLPAMHDSVLNLTDSVANTAPLNHPIFLTGSLVYSGDECDTTNNSQTITEVVVGSLDPNDKLVLVKDIGIDQFIEVSQSLVYKIRFQNVGNYSAKRVKIIDTLDVNLDLNSFKMISSSHPFTLSLIDGVLTWLNPSIELPDSASNLEGSQGYISFSIQPKMDCKPFDVIFNSASIQFDYNNYIPTNQTEITVIPNGTMPSNIKIFVYPNPTLSRSEIILLENNRPKPFNQIDIISLGGQTIHTEKSTAIKRFELNAKQLAAGMYLLRIIDENGKSHSGKLIVLSTNDNIIH